MEIHFDADGALKVESRHPHMSIPLSRGRKVLIEGGVYGVSPRGLKALFERHAPEEAARRFEGDFIGVLVDGRGATVFADALNRTEIYYARCGRVWSASTDLEKVIRSLDRIDYDQAALSNYFAVYGGYAPKRMTFYREVRRLGVGESLRLSRAESGVRGVPFRPERTGNFANGEHEEYARDFEDAVRIRSSKRMNWVFLSSGWDSTGILAMLVKLHGPSKVRGVIGRMDYSRRAGTINQFELDRARKFAAYYGIRLDVVPLDLRGQDAVEYLERSRALMRRQHLYTLAGYNFFRLTDFILKNGGPEDPVFSGEISDGAHNLGFSQYATILDHPDLGFREYSDKMASYLFSPSFFKRVLAGDYKDDAIYGLLRARAGASRFDDEKPLDERQRRLKFVASLFLRGHRLPFYSLRNSKVLTARGVRALEDEVASGYLAEAAEKMEPETLYAWFLRLYNSFHWQGSTARMFGTRLALEGRKARLPYWDSRLQSFLSRMPEDWGRGLELRPTKYPLKWTLANRVDYPMELQTGPHSYLYDVNPRFNHASEVLFASRLAPHFKSLLKDRPYEQILSRETFDLDYLARLVKDYRAGVEFGGQERNDLMSLTVLSLVGWY